MLIVYLAIIDSNELHLQKSTRKVRRSDKSATFFFFLHTHISAVYAFLRDIYEIIAEFLRNCSLGTTLYPYEKRKEKNNVHVHFL